MRYWKLTTVVLAFASMTVPARLTAQVAEHDVLVRWFLDDKRDDSLVPGGSKGLDRAEVAAWTTAMWSALVAAKRQLGDDDLVAAASSPNEAIAGELRIGEYRMPYVLLQKGEKPQSGWPLWICLHGGGGNDQAEGPHAWSVNTREWDAQKRLFERVYQGSGLYFLPRMADDRRGRWWFDHNQVAFAEVIRKAILFREVDPDRVYMMGISEGGYGAIRFAGNRPDRFAACGAMAAAEPLSTSPPEDMRNVSLRIDIGEKDTMFDRIGLARRMGERLAELKAMDPSGYDFALNVQTGRGHGIDYSLTPKWLETKVREPRPKCIVVTVQPFDSLVELRSHWLALEERPKRLPLRFRATCEGNRIAITAEHDAPIEVGTEQTRTSLQPATEGTLLVRIDDDLCNLDLPIELSVNGVARTPVMARRSTAVIARTLLERCDPRGAFCAEIRVSLGQD